MFIVVRSFFFAEHGLHQRQGPLQELPKEKRVKETESEDHLEERWLDKKWKTLTKKTSWCCVAWPENEKINPASQNRTKIWRWPGWPGLRFRPELTVCQKASGSSQNLEEIVGTLKPDLAAVRDLETEVIEEKSLGLLRAGAKSGLNLEVFPPITRTVNLEIGTEIPGPKARVGLQLQQRLEKNLNLEKRARHDGTIKEEVEE